MPFPAAKRRKLDNSNFKTNRVAEITFDPAARQEYLTGFHKRKQQRIQNARDAALKREKEERLQERRQIREQRKDELVRHVAEVNAELRKQNPDLSDDEFGEDVEDGEENVKRQNVIDHTAAHVQQDEEYVDEDKYTTVTVEAMDLAHGHDERGDATDNTSLPISDEGGKRAKDSTAARPTKKKKKKIKFRYETKAERQTARKKQKLKNKAAKARRKDG